MKSTVLFFSLFLGVAVSAQTVHSVLPNNGAAVLRDYINPESAVVQRDIVAVGKFSTAAQTVDDIVTVDGSGNISCLTNNNDGTFSAPVSKFILPPPLPGSSSALPITAVRVVSIPGSTDLLLLASNAGLDGNAGTSTLTQLNFSGCVPTISNQNFNQGPILFISDAPVVLTLPVCSEIMLSAPTANPIPGVNTFCATQFWPGPFSFSSNVYQDAAVIVQKFGAAGPATFSFIVNGGQTNQTPLEGDYFLAFIKTADGNIVAVSSTGNQLFLDEISIVNGEPGITSVGTYTLADNPVGMVVGNFWNDTQNSDIAIAAGNEITVLTYTGAAGRPVWSLVETLTASGPIGAISTGSLVPNGSDIVVQVGGNAEVFSAVSFTEVVPPPLPPPPPPPVTFTLSVQMVGAPGNVAQTPAGESFPSGTVVTLTATAGSGSTFSQWSGGCSGSQLTCTVTLAADTTILATFTAAPTPSLAVAPPSATVSAGNSASFALTPQNFTSTPTLTASCVIPKGACSIVSGQLVVTTTAPSTVMIFPFNWYRLPWAPMLLTVLVLFSIYLAPSRRTIRVGAAVACCILLVGCSVSGSSPTPQPVPGTPSGTYTITVSATSGSTVVTSNASLKVQ